MVRMLSYKKIVTILILLGIAFTVRASYSITNGKDKDSFDESQGIIQLKGARIQRKGKFTRPPRYMRKGKLSI